MAKKIDQVNIKQLEPGDVFHLYGSKVERVWVGIIYDFDGLPVSVKHTLRTHPGTIRHLPTNAFVFHHVGIKAKLS